MCLSFPPNINTHTPYFSPQFLSLSLKFKLQEWRVVCFLLFRFEGAQVGQAQGCSGTEVNTEELRAVGEESLPFWQRLLEGGGDGANPWGALAWRFPATHGSSGSPKALDQRSVLCPPSCPPLRSLPLQQAHEGEPVGAGGGEVPAEPLRVPGASPGARCASAGGRCLQPFRSPPGDWIIAVHAAHFFFMEKFECHFFNGTERVRLLDRHYYNGEEILRFDSDVGEYRAVTELGRPEAKDWNSRKDILEQRRAEVDTYCRHNYRISDTFLVPRRAEPTVTVYPAKTQPLQHHNLLVCSVTGFYPGHVEVRWFRNGQEEAAGVVSTGLIPNGDWTFQTMVMLETVPQSGEVYSCRVEHPSLTSPVTVEWSERLSDSLVPQAPRRGCACP
uniref:Ig-like domain-containing protein n=11 Tax=Suidae TaxID=9821 RepID=A0A4X1V9E0_PIG